MEITRFVLFGLMAIFVTISFIKAVEASNKPAVYATLTALIATIGWTIEFAT